MCASPSFPLCGGMLAFQGTAGQWGQAPLSSIVLALSTAGTQGARMRCLGGPFAPRITGSTQKAVRARCPHECTKQTLAGLRPRGTGGPSRRYERCGVARPEHLNLWQAGLTFSRLLGFDPERATNNGRVSCLSHCSAEGKNQGCGVGPSIGFVARRVDDLSPSRAPSLIAGIDISELNKDTLSRRLRFVCA
jgi:hypothetical protein